MVGLYFLFVSLGSLTLKSERDVASRSGLMAPSMKGGGRKTKPTERGDSSMLTEISMMAIGRMTKLMDSAYTATSMAQDTRETGKRISSTARVSKPGPMVLVTRATMWKARNMDRVSLHGPMAAPIRESSTRITSRAKV